MKNQTVALMMEAVNISETSVNFYKVNNSTSQKTIIFMRMDVAETGCETDKLMKVAQVHVQWLSLLFLNLWVLLTM
jgi:hypothetical protein